MIKILKYGQTDNDKIFSRVEPKVDVSKIVSEIIENVKKNAEQGNFIIDRDKFNRFYYKLRNAQKSVICIGEAYDSLESCVNAIESVRRFSLTAVFVAE